MKTLKSIKTSRITLAILLAFFVFVVGSLFFIGPSKSKTASAAGEVTVEEHTVEVPLSMFTGIMNVAGTNSYYLLSETIYITQRFVVDYSYELEPFRSGSLVISSSSKGGLFQLIFATPASLNDTVINERITTTINASNLAVNGMIQSHNVYADLTGSGFRWASLFSIGLTDNQIVINGSSDDGRGIFSLSISFVSSMMSIYTTSNLYTATNPFLIYTPFKQNGGYNEGYDTGWDRGYNDGRSDGYTEGYDNAYEVGHQEGYTEGHDDGYNVGLTVGKNSITGDALGNSIKGFVFSLFDAPVSTFMSVFNFDYDGFHIGSLVSFIFSIAIVSGILKVIL